MDIKDSYLHGTVGVVKSISVSADKLTYKLADINNTAKTITLPLATTTANGLMSKDDKIAINSLGNYVTLNTDQEITGTKTFTKQLKFTVAKGTAPFLVTSDTKVDNLNADLLDGYHRTDIIQHHYANENTSIDLNNLISGTAIVTGHWAYAGSANVSNLPWDHSAANIWTLPGIYNLQIAKFYNSNDIRVRGYRSSGWTSWQQLAFTDSDITGNAASADKLKTKRKLWGLDFDGTADVSGNLTGVKYLFADPSSTLELITPSGSNLYIYFRYNNNDLTSVALTGTGFVPTAASSNKITLGATSNKWKAVYATDFIGNLDGTYVNKLTGYQIATVRGAITTSDSLNTALGKLEYKAYLGETAYDWYKSVTGTDNDDIINKWEEIVDFIDSVKEGTDITDEFVTRKTDLTITGLKTFQTSTGNIKIEDASVKIDMKLNGSWARGFEIINTNNSKKVSSRFGAYGNGDSDGDNVLYYTFISHGSLGYSDATLKIYGDKATISDNEIYHKGNLKNLSDLNDDVVNGKYLPLTGGTISNAATGDGIVKINATNSLAWGLIGLSRQDVTQAVIGADKAYGFWILNVQEGSNKLLFKIGTTDIKYGSYKIWHEGNDGPGSGLDADLLDSMHAHAGTSSTIATILPNTIVARGSDSSIAVGSIRYTLKDGVKVTQNGWYRIYSGIHTASGNSQTLIRLGKSYGNVYNELYFIALTMGHGVCASITQLTGCYRKLSHLYIKKLRIVFDGESSTSTRPWYVDCYILCNGDSENYCVDVSGTGTVLKYISTPDVPTSGTVFGEFELVNGFSTKMYTQDGVSEGFNGVANDSKYLLTLYQNSTAFYPNNYKAYLKWITGNIAAFKFTDGTFKFLSDLATQLSTSRKLWGLNFDGSADVNGDMHINNNVSIHFKDSNGTSKQALGFTTNNTLLLGHGMGQSGYDTAIRGTNIYIQYGSNNSNAIAVKSTGNVGIGNTGPSEKLEVSGNVKATKFIKSGGTSSQFLKADGSIDSNTYATTSSLGDYITLVNSVIKGSLKYTFVATGGDATGWNFYKNDGTRLAALGAYAEHSTLKGIYLGWGASPWLESTSLFVSDSKLSYKSLPILHSGNYSNYALPLTGGILTGKDPYHQKVLTLNTNNQYYVMLGFEMGSDYKGSIYYTTASQDSELPGMNIRNVTGNSWLTLADTGSLYFNKKEIWHKGNLTSLSQLTDDLQNKYVTVDNTEQLVLGLKKFGESKAYGAFSGANAKLALKTDGGWAREYYFVNTSNDTTVSGGFGAYGWGVNSESKANALNYLYIRTNGQDHSNPTVRIYSNKIRVAGDGDFKNLYIRGGSGSNIQSRAVLIINSPANQNSDIVFKHNSDSTGSYGLWAISSRNDDDGRFSIYRGNENIGTASEKELFTILHTGNVGIGTKTPSAKLTVYGAGETLWLHSPDSSAVGIRFSRPGNTSWNIIDSLGNLRFTELTSNTTRLCLYENALGGLADFAGKVQATSFITKDGTSSQFVKGDGSLDSTSYATVSSLDNYIKYVDLYTTSTKKLKYLFRSLGLTNKGNDSTLDDCPTSYGAYMSIAYYSNKNSGFLLYADTSNQNKGIYYRTRQAGDSNTTYRDWRRVLDENNYSSYALSLSGGTMNNGASITIQNQSNIIHTTASTSNAVKTIQWYTGSSHDATYKYPACLGWHNMGGDGDGAITLVPYALDSSWWAGSVGLYIAKTFLLFNNNNILHAGNYTLYVNSTNFPGLAGVRSVTINGDYLKVNTNGTDANLTINYATKANRSYYLETLYQDGSQWYGGLYKFYALWGTSTILDLKCDGYSTRVNLAKTLDSTAVISAKAFSLSNASWTDTGYTFKSLTSGTYAVQVTSGSNLVASGIMSVYKNLSDTAGDEIPLHVYGTAGWRPYLRTYANKLLISSNDASATSRTVTIKIALIL